MHVAPRTPYSPCPKTDFRKSPARSSERAIFHSEKLGGNGATAKWKYGVKVPLNHRIDLRMRSAHSLALRIRFHNQQRILPFAGGGKRFASPIRKATYRTGVARSWINPKHLPVTTCFHFGDVDGKGSLAAQIRHDPLPVIMSGCQV